MMMIRLLDHGVQIIHKEIDELWPEIILRTDSWWSMKSRKHRKRSSRTNKREPVNDRHYTDRVSIGKQLI